MANREKIRQFFPCLYPNGDILLPQKNEDSKNGLLPSSIVSKFISYG